MDAMTAPIAERLAVAVQHVLPQRLLTEAAGRVARAEWGAPTQALIRRLLECTLA